MYPIFLVILSFSKKKISFVGLLKGYADKIQESSFKPWHATQMASFFSITKSGFRYKNKDHVYRMRASSRSENYFEIVVIITYWLSIWDERYWFSRIVLLMKYTPKHKFINNIDFYLQTMDDSSPRTSQCLTVTLRSPSVSDFSDLNFKILFFSLDIIR